GTLAYPLLVLALTHSALIAGAVSTVASGAAFAVRLPAGALADPLRRRRAGIRRGRGRAPRPPPPPLPAPPAPVAGPVGPGSPGPATRSSTRPRWPHCL